MILQETHQYTIGNLKEAMKTVLPKDCVLNIIDTKEMNMAMVAEFGPSTKIMCMPMVAQLLGVCFRDDVGGLKGKFLRRFEKGFFAGRGYGAKWACLEEFGNAVEVSQFPFSIGFFLPGLYA